MGDWRLATGDWYRVVDRLSIKQVRAILSWFGLKVGEFCAVVALRATNDAFHFF